LQTRKHGLCKNKSIEKKEMDKCPKFSIKKKKKRERERKKDSP